MAHRQSFKLNTFLFSAFAIVIVNVASAEMCKWVDEDGCVHYAKQCPEGVEGQNVGIQQGPSEEAVKQAEKRSEQLQEVVSRQRQAEQESAEKMATERAVKSTVGINTQLCTKVWHTIARLERQWPVYADSEGYYHLRESLHSWYYEGKRNWLTDDLRQAELNISENFIEQKCKGVTAIDIPNLITYKFAPSLLETIRTFEDTHFEGFAKISRERNSDWCTYAKTMLGAVEAGRAPGGEVRRLKELLEEKCN